MKKLFVGSLLLLACSRMHAQKVHLTLFGGISNYQGDLQSKRFTFQQANAAVGFGGLYEFSDRLYLRANLTVAKIAGDDLKGKNPGRNLNFSSPITDVNLGLEYDLMNSYEHTLVPFVFAGVTLFHFNPSTIDTTGAKVLLQPLGTEGQGFYQDRKKYKLTNIALPFGGGLKFALSENIKVRLEMGFRKTGTDYLDDVSTTYADETALILNNGPKAADLAFRGDENKTGLTYPAANTVRGNPKSKDWYYFTGIGISFRLAPKFSGTGNKRTNTNCPPAVL